MADKNVFTQEELNDLKLNEPVPVERDIKNLIVLIRNELNTLEDQIVDYPKNIQTKVVKRLNKVLNSIINVRKV